MIVHEVTLVSDACSYIVRQRATKQQHGSPSQGWAEVSQPEIVFLAIL